MTSSVAPAEPVVGPHLQVGQRVRIAYRDTSTAAGVRGSVVELNDLHAIIRSDKSGKDVRVPLENIARAEVLPESASRPSRLPDLASVASRPWIAPAQLALSAIAVLLLLVVVGQSRGGAVESEVYDLQFSLSTLQSDIDGIRSDMADLSSGVSDLQAGVTIRSTSVGFGQQDPIQQRFDEIARQLDAIQQTVNTICRNSNGSSYTYSFC